MTLASIAHQSLRMATLTKKRHLLVIFSMTLGWPLRSGHDLELIWPQWGHDLGFYSPAEAQNGICDWKAPSISAPVSHAGQY
jgi:hypothetical protein